MDEHRLKLFNLNVGMVEWIHYDFPIKLEKVFNDPFEYCRRR